MTYDEQGMQSKHSCVVMRPFENQTFDFFASQGFRERFCNYYSRTSIYYREANVCVHQACVEKDESRKFQSYEIVCKYKSGSQVNDQEISCSIEP